MHELARVTNQVKEKAPTTELEGLRNEVDGKEKIRIDEENKIRVELRADILDKATPIHNELEKLNNEINAIKLNIIAAGQMDPGFSTEQGLQVTSEVARLTTKFDSLAKEQAKQFGQVRTEAQNNIQ